MTRSALLLISVASALSGCGDHRLIATGFARVETADLTTELRLPVDTRIDGGGSVSGSCQLTRSVDGSGVHYGVVVDLFRGGSADGGLRSFAVMGRTDATAGAIEATLGSGEFHSDAACAVSVASVSDGGDIVLDATGCALTGPGGAVATASTHLELSGCTIVGM